MRVLVLNADFRPYDIWGWKKAMKKWIGEKNVYVVCGSGKDIVDGSGNKWPVPSVIALKQYVDNANKNANYTKMNIYIRDMRICQYCGKTCSTSELTVDHVIPRSQWKKRNIKGPVSSFTNVVTACEHCNFLKGDKTPDEAGMPLLHNPVKQTRSQIFHKKTQLGHVPEEWEDYLSIGMFDRIK